MSYKFYNYFYKLSSLPELTDLQDILTRKSLQVLE